MSDTLPINLNLPTDGIDTKFPSISAGEYKATVSKIEPKEYSTPGTYGLDVTFTLQEPATSTANAPIAPGFEFRHNLSLPVANGHAKYNEVSDHPQNGIRIRQLCAFLDACLGTTKETRPALTNDLLPRLVGTNVKVKIKNKKTPDQYGDTEVQSIEALSA